MYIDPWSNKTSLRSFLSKIKEDGELDTLVIIYVRDILKHRIIRRPSKGPYGEQGKDVVAIENEKKEYCSYIVKRGDLNRNLDGKYGIIKQLEDAINIPLEEVEYHTVKRTARVVHNGSEGNRSAINKYEENRQQIEQDCKNIMLRNIERWDLDYITDFLFDNKGELIKNEQISNMISIRDKICQAAIEFYVDAQSQIGDAQSRENTFKSRIANLESENGYSFNKMWCKDE